MGEPNCTLLDPSCCENDFLCPGSEVHYCDVSRLEDKVGNLTTTYCDCSAWWGYTGDNCTAAGPTALFLIASSVVIGCLSLLTLTYNLMIAYNIVKLNHTKKWNSSNATLLFTTLGALGVLLWRITTLIIVMTPTLAEEFKLATLPGEKLHVLIPAEKTAIGMSVTFGMLSAITVVIAWVDIVNKSRAMMPASQRGAFANFTKPVIEVGLAFSLVIVIASSVGRMEIAVVASFPFFFIVVVAYIYAYFQMGKLVRLMEGITGSDGDKSSSQETRDQPADSFAAKNRGSVRRAMSTVTGAMGSGSKKSRKRTRYITMLNKVRRTAALVVLSIIALAACAGFYAVPMLFSSWRELCDPGVFCIYAASLDLSSLWILAIIATVQLFIYENYENQFSRLKRARSESGYDHGSSVAARTSIVPPSPLPVTVSAPMVSPMVDGDGDCGASL